MWNIDPMPHKLQAWFLEQPWFWAAVHLGCRRPYLIREFSAKLGSSSSSIPRSSSLIGSSCCLFCFYCLRRTARQQASMLVACVFGKFRRRLSSKTTCSRGKLLPSTLSALTCSWKQPVRLRLQDTAEVQALCCRPKEDGKRSMETSTISGTATTDTRCIRSYNPLSTSMRQDCPNRMFVRSRLASERSRAGCNCVKESRC